MTVATGLDTTEPSAGRAALVRWAWRLAPVWCGLGALVLDLALLARRSVRWQEAQAVAAASGDWGDLWHAIRGHEAPHAAADALLKLWIGAAGSGEWAIRAPAALAGAVAVALTCALGTRLLGRVGGLVAAGALATNAIVLAWSQTVGSESLALVAVVLATIALVSALDRPVWRRLALWGVASVAAVAISLLALPAILAHVAAWAARGPRSQWRTPAVTAGVVALSAIAMAAFVATSDADTLAWGAPDGGDLGLDVCG
jgi:mannosyltransferase